METTDDIAGENPESIPAVSVAVVDGDRVLLVRRGREPSKGNYAFPGGRIEPGESDEQAARREVLEETGLILSDLTVFQNVIVAGSRDGAAVLYRLSVFRADAFEGEPIAGDDAEAVGWFTLADLDALPMTRSMADAVRAVLAR